MAPRGLHLHHPRDMPTVTGIATAEKDVIIGTRLTRMGTAIRAILGQMEVRAPGRSGLAIGEVERTLHRRHQQVVGGSRTEEHGNGGNGRTPPHPPPRKGAPGKRQTTTTLTSCNWEGAPLLRLDWLTQVMYKRCLRGLQKHQDEEFGKLPSPTSFEITNG